MFIYPGQLGRAYIFALYLGYGLLLLESGGFLLTEGGDRLEVE